MFKELEVHNFQKVRELFSEIEEIDLSVTSVFEKNYPGRILVDDLTNPLSAFLQLGHRTLIFVGNEKNERFNLSVLDEINYKIIPTRMSHFVNKYFFLLFSKNWLETIPQLFPESVLITRKYYVFDKMKIPIWRELVPESYTIHQIDRDSFQVEAVKEHKMINKWITDIYGTQENFLDRGIGFYMIYNGEEIVSYNIINYVNNDRKRIEMGIITEEKFQRMGLTKLLVSATLEHCVKEGINKIGWHTNVKNIASQKTAESAGFILNRDYDVFLGKWE